MGSGKIKYSITKISKNSRRFKVTTTFFLTQEEYYKVIKHFQKINNFALKLVDDYKYEENEGIMFMESKMSEYPFGYKIHLISIVGIELYNKRLVIVNKHKRVVKLVENFYQNRKEVKSR